MADLEKPKKQLNSYARFSSLALQMGITIGGFTWLGFFLDRKYNPGGQAWTLCLSLFGVFVALYLIIREVTKMSKDKES